MCIKNQNVPGKSNCIKDAIYIDDGISGYKFDRPGFNRLMEDLRKDIDAVFVKDFSRLGRHNAKVLLLLDEFQERGKRLIVIDDHYDSLTPDDDVIGIKTWYNERYVKDASKKIRRVLSARQKEGTLLTQVPFGYMRNEQKKEIIEIVPKEAEQIRQIYELYMQGLGYRKIAQYLTRQLVPTPSAVRHERELAQGRRGKRHVALEWSDSMVKEILGNDFYIGTYRLHKRARITIHGKEKRVPKEEQCVFENHHVPIIDQMTFTLVQDLKAKRVKSNYHGSRGQWTKADTPRPFGTCLFCKDCNSRLTPITRKTSGGERKYYICSTYNTKGKRHCAKAHLIEEDDLMEDVAAYIRLCRTFLYDRIAAYDLKDFKTEKKSTEEKRTAVKNRIEVQKRQLKSLFAQKIHDLAAHEGEEAWIADSYDSLQNDILARIRSLELQLQELSESAPEPTGGQIKLANALEVLDEMIANREFTRKDIEVLIERIVVDENGMPEITCKWGLSEFMKCSPAEELNRRENEIIAAVMRLIDKERRSYTSARYLSAKLTQAGYAKSRKAVLPYLHIMIEKGLLEPSDDPLRPYSIIKTKEDINIVEIK